MGRSSSLKSNDPNPLPHDGPLYQFLSPSSSLTDSLVEDNNTSELHNDSVTKAALEYLQPPPSTTITTSSSTSSVESQLVTTLQQATQLKEQLQALQTFKSKLIVRHAHQTETQQQHDATTTTTTSITVVLYRILLEWFLSYQTPLPLRRAIQATLDGMIMATPSNTTTALELEQQQTLVLQSVITTTTNSQMWQQPLHSLYEAWNYKATPQDMLTKYGKMLQVLHYLQWYAQEHIQPLVPTHASLQQQENVVVELFVEPSVTKAIQRAIQWAAILKTILAEAPTLTIVPYCTTSDCNNNDNDNSTTNTTVPTPLLQYFEQFLWQIMTCRITPVDSLSNLGMAYARVVLLQKPPLLHPSPRENDNDHDSMLAPTNDICTSIPSQITNLQQQQQQQQSASQPLPHLVAIAIVQGLAATVPIPIMIQDSNILLHYFQQESNEADPGVRLAALKGILTLVSRCLTRLLQQQNQNSNIMDNCCEIQAMQEMAQGTLEIVMQAWENPPNRRLSTTIPSLFQKLVALLQELGKIQSTVPSALPTLSKEQQEQQPTQNNRVVTGPFEDLVTRLLAQPPNRKGRYKALETLLPIVGALQIMQLGNNGWELIESLLEGIGDRNSHTAGAIADLWQKILSDLLHDMLVAPENTNNNNNNNETASDNPLKPLNDKKKQKKGKEFALERFRQILPLWWDTWVPSLAAGLLSITPSRRKHVASFCLPRILAMVGGRKMQAAAAATFACLLKTIHQREKDETGELQTSNVGQLGGLRDRSCWATLETIKHANSEKLVNGNPECAEFIEAIASYMPIVELRAALKHFTSNIRLVAFQTIRPVVFAHQIRQNSSSGCLEAIDHEIRFWREALPYAIKSEGKEYKSTLLLCLTSFLDRISSEESTSLEQPQPSDLVDRNCGRISYLPLTRLHSFVVEFLVFTVAVQQAAYPGSVAEKEAFGIDLLGCILDFAARDYNFVPRNVAVYDRRRVPAESEAATKMIKALLSREAVSALVSLLHSTWDGTRAAAFRLLSRLVIVGQANNLPIAPEYTSIPNRLGMEARGVYLGTILPVKYETITFEPANAAVLNLSASLASSPRQREADTGARILAFLYFSLDLENDRRLFLEKLVDLLDRRMAMMKGVLAALLSGEIDSTASCEGAKLPLAHGLVHSLNLIIEHAVLGFKYFAQYTSPESYGTYEHLASIFCLGIQISLTVVADVKEGTLIDGMDEDLVVHSDGMNEQTGTPLNVNTGAIGANGTFSSINSSKKEEHYKRIAIQRIVMGSWLLTREACGALATLLCSNIFPVSEAHISRAGVVLVSTLISLKHAGAAFAAHRALQRIAEFCFCNSNNPEVAKLPTTWTHRLLEEISNVEKVRDSTLRRSTGYALGFLAIMRSEVSSKVEQRTLCPFILKNILALSLPSNKELLRYCEKLKLSTNFFHSVFPNLSVPKETTSFDRSPHEMCSRVHALNVLRLIILDAPLAHEVGPFVGEAIISAVTGYIDEQWAVRNSSTMVFAAVMLRSVDADKNASNADTLSSNSITIGELSRSYPFISHFLNAVLVSGNGEALDTRTAAPPRFPLLLLLSRVQPVSTSGPESKELSEPFVAGVFQSLMDRDLSIRTAASRALANLCSGRTGNSVSSISAMLAGSHRLLFHAMTRGEWNSIHGGTMAIKELFVRFPESGDWLRDAGLVEYFLRVTKSASMRALWPPVCLSVVFNILSMIASSTDTSHDWRQQFIKNSEDTMLDVEKAATSSDGLSDLAITVGQIICNDCVAKVWDVSLSVQELEEPLTQLCSLLSSPCTDVRLHACKSFKKSIYEKIDELLIADDATCADRCTKLVVVSSTLVAAIHRELARDKDEGIHPPSLRRLSRCLLECLEGHRSLDGESAGEGRPLPSDLVSAISTIGERLIDQDDADDADEFSRETPLSGNEFRRETPMSGNGAELVSFAVAEHLRQSEAEFLSGYIGRIQNFAATITRLNDPALSWRLRHSAAVAVVNSKLLEWQGSDLKMKQIQHKLLENVLIMLQDSDPDVRCAAGRAAQVIQGLLNSGSNTVWFPSVSQCVLEQTCVYAYHLSDCDETQDVVHEYARHLFHSILKRCEGLHGKLDMLQSELANTEASTDLDKLLNVGTERKIFEDEVANPYEERAFANQLSVQSLLRLPLVSPPEMIISQLTHQCQEILTIVKGGFREGRAQDLLHEVTRSSAIFAGLHSLIIAATTVVYFGGKGFANIQELATSILSMPLSDHKLHHSISLALEILARAEMRSDKTRNGLLECLFLLPESMRS